MMKKSFDNDGKICEREEVKKTDDADDENECNHSREILNIYQLFIVIFSLFECEIFSIPPPIQKKSILNS
jgi:hypothetical protein